MILLDSSDSLQVLLAGAVATSQPVLYAAFADHAPGSFTPGSSSGATNGATAVDWVAAPSEGNERQVKYLSLYNADTTPVVATVRVVDNASNRILLKVSLLTGERMEYLDGKGFRVLDTGGAEKVTSVVSGNIVLGPSPAVDNTLPRFDGTAGNLLQGSGIAVTDNNEISGYRGHLNQQTGTTYTLQASDAGKIVELTNAASIALTAPNSLPAGFACTVVQGGAGQVTVASSGSGSVVNRQSQFKTAGVNAMCALYVRSNSGTNAVWVFGGDTAT